MLKRKEGLKMSSGEGCRRKDSATKVGPVSETRMRAGGKMRSGIKVFHDNNSQESSKTTSCSSSLSSIEDEKVSSMRSNHGVNYGKRKAWKPEGSDQVSKQCMELSISSYDGIKRSPAAQIKKAMTLPSPSSPFRKGIAERNESHSVKLRKVKSESCRDFDRPSNAHQLLTGEFLVEDASTSDDPEAVIESDLDLGKSLDRIERSGSDGGSKEVRVGGAPVKITSNNEDDDSFDEEEEGEEGEDEEEEEDVSVIEEKKLVLNNERPLRIPPIDRKLYPVSAIDARNHPNQVKVKPVSEHFHEAPTTHSKLQNLKDLIMWRDASKSALVFGIGAFAAVSSSHSWDFNISFISVLSYLGLVYLAAVFIFRSFIARESTDDKKQETCELVGEEEAIWVMKLVLPYVNEFLLNLRVLFSGDPITTIKLAVLLFIFARYGGSITIWKLAKLGFVVVFTVPKACSLYSTQLTSFGIFWMEKIGDGWKSCSHKKAIGFVIFSVVWNVTSVVARIWTLFVLFVAFRCYQQSSITESEEIQEGTMDGI